MPLTLDQITVATGPYQAPAMSTHGYIVQPSGAVYALTQRYVHGLVLAILYPDRFLDYQRLNRERGIVMPKAIDDFPAIFRLQHFEMEVSHHINVVRICPSRVVGPTSIDLPHDPIAAPQLYSVRSIFSLLGLVPRSIINTDLADMSVAQCLELAALPKQERPNDRRLQA